MVRGFIPLLFFSRSVEVNDWSVGNFICDTIEQEDPRDIKAENLDAINFNGLNYQGPRYARNKG